MQTEILYVASTASHLHRFHEPYIEALRRGAHVSLMASEGEGIDYPLTFNKSFFSVANLGTVRKIRKILKKTHFDKVIVNTSLAAFLVRAAMIGLRRRPYVLNVVHGYLFPSECRGLKNKLLLLCEKMLRKKTDDIAVMNHDDAVIAKKYRLCLGNIYETRGMGLPEKVFPARDETLRARFVKHPDEYLCTFVGELSNRKNQRFLVSAFARLRAEGLPVRLLLAGEGSERAHLEEQIKARGLEESVFLPGNLEPIVPYLAATDLYVSASTSEGLPFNVMEAMQCGLPMILSATKGQTDLLPGENGGMLYPLNDEDAFCALVKQMIDSGKRGAGSTSYPQLEAYLLSSVLEENLAVWKEMNRKNG